MSRSNLANRVDGNQAEIVAALEGAGYCVLDLHDLGRGVLDLLVVSRTDASRVMLIEVKVPGAKLTEAEREFTQSYRGRWRIARSIQEALEIMADFDVETQE